MSFSVIRKTLIGLFRRVRGNLITTPYYGYHRITHSYRYILKNYDLNYSPISSNATKYSTRASRLNTGTALKKKFDDIFESTRYTKALKVISDERKKQRNEMKDLERDLSLIKSRAENVQQLVRERDECKEKREEIGEKIKRYENVVKDSDERLSVGVYFYLAQ